MRKTAILSAALAVMPVWALAQEEQADTAMEPQQQELRLDEIVVTAQKRAENIQDVPLSISAVGGETLREKSIEDVNELGNYTPNTKITAGNGSGSFIKMRGLGSGNNKGFEQAVGLIIDGVYYGRIDYLATALVDLDRVEVLRGPQGTLMGKNTIAGALSFTTMRPDHDWGFDASYAAGELNKSKINLAVNVPVVEDVLALRVVGHRDRRDGFVTNTHTNDDQLDIHRNLIRAKAAFDGIDNLTVTATAEWWNLKQQLWGFEINKSTPQNMAAYSAFDPNYEANVDRRNQTDQDGIAHRENITLSLQAEYDIGEYTLTSVTGWSNMTFTNQIDADFGPAPLLTLGTDDEWTQFSQELRITSPLGQIDYVAGLFFFMSEFDNFSDLALLNDTDPTDLIGGLLLPDAIAPLLSQFPGIGPVTEDHSYGDFYQESFSVAGFGQVRAHFLDDDLTLMVGLRYSYEEKEAQMTREFTSTGIVFIQALAQEEFVLPTQKRIERDISPKVSVTYAVNEEINVYGTLAQAFKGGGYNASAVQANEFEFEEEKANTFEVGFKGRLMGGAIRLNVAAFYTEFENLQVSIFDGTKFVVKNAANATTKGVEMDAMAVLAEGLFVNLSVGYTHARYDDFPNGPCMDGADEPCDLSGGELDRAPDWNGTFGVSYALPLGNLPFDLTMGGDVNYQGDHYINTDLDPNEFQEAHFIYNARIGLMDNDQLWQFLITGKNLSDEVVLMGGADVPAQAGSHMGTYGAPRLFSAEFRVRF
ncbi:MAG: TonB-dependent receptor [Alphaproteobacteria bacterium]